MSKDMIKCLIVMCKYSKDVLITTANNSFFFRHYPQPKPTVVVDNPEMQRIRALTDIQSNVWEIHEEIRGMFWLCLGEISWRFQ